MLLKTKIKIGLAIVVGVPVGLLTAYSARPPIVNLGTAAQNGVMAGSTITCVAGGIINADISLSPGTSVTGFPPCVATGVQHVADAVAAQAQLDLTAAYNTLAALACPNVVGTADLGGLTKSPGVYCSGSSIGVTGTLTLDGGGDPNATFVFQAGSTLTTAGSIALINGARAENEYWLVGSSATLGTASQWQGTIIAVASITVVTDVTIVGRVLARNAAVTLGTGTTITLPSSPTPEAILIGETFGAYASTPAGSLPKTAFATLPIEHGMSSADGADVSVPGVIDVSFLDTKVTGSASLEYASVQSVTSVEGIDLLGGVITADALVALSVSLLDGADAESHADGTTFAGLKVNGVPVTDLSPNTTIQLPGIGKVTFNERIAGGDGTNSSSLTVNLIHVRIENALGELTGEIIVGSAKSYISR